MMHCMWKGGVEHDWLIVAQGPMGSECRVGGSQR